MNPLLKGFCLKLATRTQNNYIFEFFWPSKVHMLHVPHSLIRPLICIVLQSVGLNISVVFPLKNDVQHTYIYLHFEFMFYIYIYSFWVSWLRWTKRFVIRHHLPKWQMLLKSLRGTLNWLWSSLNLILMTLWYGANRWHVNFTFLLKQMLALDKIFAAVSSTAFVTWRYNQHKMKIPWWGFKVYSFKESFLEQEWK